MVATQKLYLLLLSLVKAARSCSYIFQFPNITNMTLTAEEYSSIDLVFLVSARSGSGCGAKPVSSGHVSFGRSRSADYCRITHQGDTCEPTPGVPECVCQYPGRYHLRKNVSRADGGDWLWWTSHSEQTDTVFFNITYPPRVLEFGVVDEAVHEVAHSLFLAPKGRQVVLRCSWDQGNPLKGVWIGARDPSREEIICGPTTHHGFAKTNRKSSAQNCSLTVTPSGTCSSPQTYTCQVLGVRHVGSLSVSSLFSSSASSVATQIASSTTEAAISLSVQGNPEIGAARLLKNGSWLEIPVCSMDDHWWQCQLVNTTVDLPLPTGTRVNPTAPSNQGLFWSTAPRVHPTVHSHPFTVDCLGSQWWDGKIPHRTLSLPLPEGMRDTRQWTLHISNRLGSAGRVFNLSLKDTSGITAVTSGGLTTRTQMSAAEAPGMSPAASTPSLTWILLCNGVVVIAVVVMVIVFIVTRKSKRSRLQREILLQLQQTSPHANLQQRNQDRPLALQHLEHQNLENQHLETARQQRMTRGGGDQAWRYVQQKRLSHSSCKMAAMPVLDTSTTTLSTLSGVTWGEVGGACGSLSNIYETIDKQEESRKVPTLVSLADASLPEPSSFYLTPVVASVDLLQLQQSTSANLQRKADMIQGAHPRGMQVTRTSLQEWADERFPLSSSCLDASNPRHDLDLDSSDFDAIPLRSLTDKLPVDYLLPSSMTPRQSHSGLDLTQGLNFEPPVDVGEYTVAGAFRSHQQISCLEFNCERGFALDLGHNIDLGLDSDPGLDTALGPDPRSRRKCIEPDQER